MATYEHVGNGKEAAYIMKAHPQNQRGWLPIASAVWLVISIYPVFHFFMGQQAGPSGLSHSPTQAQSVVTRTVVMPSLAATPLHGAVELERPEHAHRITDAIDIFEEFRTSERCRFSSLDLHGPFEPLCEDKESLLQAMSWGGRHGTDTPFSPRACDMRFFSPAEICAILSRFSQIIIIGDSMMRNLAVAMHIFLRADLTNGGRANWGDDPVGHDCRCEGVFDDRACTFHAVASTSAARDFDPNSVRCGAEAAGVEFTSLLEHPISRIDMDIYLKHLPAIKPQKPIAFIMGHGLWNDLDAPKSQVWVHQAMNESIHTAPWLAEPGAFFPRLFITPNAAGDKKPDLFLARQGNIALARFEKNMGSWVKEQGMDHLGTWNMSIQAFNPDGTHGGMRVNMLKAQMVFNWLNALNVDAHHRRSGH